MFTLYSVTKANSPTSGAAYYYVKKIASGERAKRVSYDYGASYGSGRYKALEIVLAETKVPYRRIDTCAEVGLTTWFVVS